MSLPFKSDTDQPIRKSAQRLRWFVEVFEKQVQQSTQETGNQFSIDRQRLTEVFAEWITAFQSQKPDNEEDKLAYVGFAAGLMLKMLVKSNPLSVESKPEGADETNPAYFWPEGYVYVAFCLNTRGLVLEHDFNQNQQLGTALGEVRTWWSFKENVNEDPSLAVAFLDLFAGDEPQWSAPHLFRSGKAREQAVRFYRSEEIEGGT